MYPEPRVKANVTNGFRLGQQRASLQDSGSSSGDSEDEDAEVQPMSSNRPPKTGPVPHSAVDYHGRSHDCESAASKSQEEGIPSPGNPRSRTQELPESIAHSLSPPTDEFCAASTPCPPSLGSRNPQQPTSVTPETLQEITTLSRLPVDHRDYLLYHRNHLTSNHYFFKNEANHFLHDILLKHALSYEPLLFAVIGFAAFQSSLNNNESKVQDFLGYYNRSVILLRKSLASGQKHTDATMLTILQLATFEVGQTLRHSIGC